MRKEYGSADSVRAAKRDRDFAFNAHKFINSNVGKFIKNDLDIDITKLLNDIAGTTPLPQDKYVEKSGALNALRGWQNKLISFAAYKDKYEEIYQRKLQEYADAEAQRRQ